MQQSLIALVEFAVKYPRWHSFAPDALTVQAVCAANNLGIVQVNDCGQFALKSANKAHEFLNARKAA